MPHDVTPFHEEGSNLPVHQPNRGPYTSPPVLSQEGMTDRRAERSHALAVRQATRDVELTRVEVAKKLARQLDEMEAEARVVTEQKFSLQRAAKESEILGGDDPELRAKFGTLDDDLFARYRRRGLRGLG